MMNHIVTILAGVGIFGSASIAAVAEGEGTDKALLLVGKHRAVWTARPGGTPANHSVDGPLMGNGDMKVAIGGPAEEQKFFLSKNDLWRLKSLEGQACPVGFGNLAIRIPDLKGATYKLEQRWDAPETVGTFTRDDLTVRMRSMVAATRNLLILQLEAEGRAVDTEAMLRVVSGRGSETKVERKGDLIFGQREFIDDVDIPSGVAVACKVVGAGTSPATWEKPAVATKTASFRVQLGREQHGVGRWGFQGAIDDLRVYGQALGETQMSALAAGKAPEGAAHVWPMDEEPGGEAPMQVVPGKVGKAWHFTGDKACFLDCGKIAIPVEPVTMACWIKIDEAHHTEANYILSSGEWNHGVSIGLSKGKLRFTAAGQYVESAVLQKDKWIHVGGTWDGQGLNAYVNGKEAGRAGTSLVQKGVRFTLEPGKPVTLVLAMNSVFKSESYAEEVVKALSDVSEKSDLSDVKTAHAAWWAEYWAKSWVELGDAEIEKAYYRSLYAMGSCSRDPRFPPGLFGWVTTDNPRWFGDYHLNYNYVAPFYGLYSANRIEQGDPEDAPILAFRERGRFYARSVFGEKMRGVHYPVGVGPLGIETTYLGDSAKDRNDHIVEKGGLFFGQRSNPAYCLVNIAQRWRTTRDPEYGKKVYPYVTDVVDFWEDYLKWEPSRVEPLSEAGRYVIHADSIQEGTGKNMNPILSLGLVRNSFDLALDMSEEFEVDADRREKWRHILDHLSSWTTQEMDGKTVFRYTEEGPHWMHNNTLGIQQIYPGNALGLDSDPKWLKIAHNTITTMQRWNDYNGSNSFFPAAVRVGYDPKVILEKLRAYAHNQYPNGFIKGNPHGIENLSTTPNTINEMLCMSHVPGGANVGGHLLRVFPVWPKDKDAKFVNIRAWGAFLVSSELQDGEVQYVRITSERAKDCTILNPWPGQSVMLTGDGRREMLSGEKLAFETGVGEQITLTRGD